MRIIIEGTAGEGKSTVANIIEHALLGAGLPVQNEEKDELDKTKFAGSIGNINRELRTLKRPIVIEHRSTWSPPKRNQTCLEFLGKVREFQDALNAATRSGALDALAGDIHPDDINKLCDVVEQMVKLEG